MSTAINTMPQSDPHFVIKDITPEYAARLLQKNPVNRQLANRHVKLLAGEMEADLWQVTNQAIGVDVEGNLTDGQHRLQGIIRSGKTVRMAIAYDLNVDAINVTDRGMKARTAGDIFSMRGCTAANIVAAAIVVINQLTHGGILRRFKEPMWQGQYDKYYDEFGLIQHWSDRSVAYKQRIIPMSIAAGLGVIFELSEKCEGDAKRFMDSLQYGTDLSAGSPVLLLRNRMIKNNNQKEHRFTRYMTCWYVIKAWNYFYSDKELKQLRVRSGEHSPSVAGFDATILPYYEED